MAMIWIVEDDPKIGMLIEMTVKKAGHGAQRMLDVVEDVLLLSRAEREKGLSFARVQAEQIAGRSVRPWLPKQRRRASPLTCRERSPSPPWKRTSGRSCTT